MLQTEELHHRISYLSFVQPEKELFCAHLIFFLFDIVCFDYSRCDRIWVVQL